MGRGKLSPRELKELKENPNVIDANGSRIIYSNEFKFYFIKEYKEGRKPRDIFEEAGFDPDVLGSKRIERACSRWREADAAETLGKYGYIRLKTKKGRRAGEKAEENEIYRQRRGVYIKALDKKKKQVERLQKAYERKVEKLQKEDLKRARKQQAKIEKLEAENEVLKKVGTLRGRRCEGKEDGKIRLYGLIKEAASKYGLHREIKRLCEVTGLPRSNYYYYNATVDKRERKEARDAESEYFIRKAFDSCKYAKKGSRTIRMILKREHDISYNRKRIQRIMRKYDIICPIKTKNPYKDMWKATKEDRIAPNLVKRNFKPGEARKLFLGDITYIKHQDHFSYASVIIDSQTNEPLAYKVSTSLKMDFVMDTLKQLEGCKISEGAIIHTDQGLHYTSKKYRDKIKEMGLTQSMSRRGNCLDNSKMESVFGHMTPFDGAVHLASCDKGTPGNLIGLARVDVPAIVVRVAL